MPIWERDAHSQGIPEAHVRRMPTWEHDAHLLRMPNARRLQKRSMRMWMDLESNKKSLKIIPGACM